MRIELNTAPQLQAWPLELEPVSNRAGPPTGMGGTAINTLVVLGLNVTDVDPGAVTGMAVISVNTLNGIWHFSTDDGTTWLEIGDVSDSSARLLAADGITRVYFQPNPDYNGTIPDAVTFRAWDQTSGANGGLADTTINGGTTAFSAATDSAALTVFHVNSAPMLDASISLELVDEFEDAGVPVGPVGTPINSLVVMGVNVTDVDPGAVTGMAVISVNTLNGIWHFSTDDGTTWLEMGDVSDSSARLLAADGITRVYFQPNPDYNGTIPDALTFRAWDQTSGANGGLADTTVNGGTSAFSAVTNTAALTVLAVNDPPSFQIRYEDGQSFEGVLRLPANFRGDRVLVVIADPPPEDEADQIVEYFLDGLSTDYVNAVFDPDVSGIRFTAIAATEGGTNSYTLTAMDQDGASWSVPFLVEVTSEPLIEAAPITYCLASSQVGTNVIFTVLGGGAEPLTYHWKVDGRAVPELNHPALKLPRPGFAIPTVAPGTEQAYIHVEVTISNALGSVTTTAAATIDSANSFPWLEVGPFEHLVTVALQAATTLGTYLSPPPDTVRWRHNGIPLYDRPGITANTATTNLYLPNIAASQVGLYEMIASSAGDCTLVVARFELEISSQLSSTNAPHSFDNLEDLAAWTLPEETPAFVATLSTHTLSKASDTGLPPRAGVDILTIPRSQHYQYLDLFASTYQEYEATLFHTEGRTNGFSQWFRLRPEQPGLNQLVTLDVSGSLHASTTVLAVYSVADATKPMSITNLHLITRFDRFSDKTQPPAGGTNAVVSFETRSHDEFWVVVDSVSNPGLVRLRWSVDPFPEEDSFQWLKVLCPPEPGVLEVCWSGEGVQPYFAFVSQENTYSSFIRIDADWESSDFCVTFDTAYAAEVYVLTDALPSETYQVDIQDTRSAKVDSLMLTFKGALTEHAILLPPPAARANLIGF